MILLTRVYHLSVFLAFTVQVMCEVIPRLPNLVNPHSLAVGEENAVVAWQYDGGNSESNVEYYIEVLYRVFDKTTKRVEFKENVPKGATQTQIWNLRSGTPYEVYLRTKYQNVEGTWSIALVIETSGPRPPRTFDVSEITDKTATISWSPPTSGIPDDYLVTLRNNNNNELIVYPALAYPATEYVIWHLEQDTPYTAFIVTRIKEKQSTNMTSGFRTDSPSVISTRVEQIEEISVLVRWETENRRILIARYDVELKDTTIEGDTESRKIYQTTSNQEVRQLKINNLKPGTLYGYRVRAVFRRNGGHGTWSKFQYFTTKLTDPPSSPVELKIEETGLTSAQFQWEAPTYKYKIQEYEIEYAKWRLRPEPIKTSSLTSFFISGLESGTEYHAKVRAVTEHNHKGLWSVQIAFSTNGPRPVSSMSVTEVKAESARITWTYYSNTTADQIKIDVMSTEKKSEVKTFTVKGTETEYIVEGLQQSTPYTVQIFVISKGETSSKKTNGLQTAGSIDLLIKQPTKPKALSRTSNQPLSTINYEFDKIPNVVVKHYLVKITGWDVPNIPFSRTQIVLPSFGGVRQSVQIKNVESGYKYKVKVLGVYHDDSQSKWSTEIAVVVPGPRPVTVIGMRSITDQDVTVSWESAYTTNDPMYKKQEYIITLSQFIDDDSLKKIAQATVHAPGEEYEFDSKLSPLERYQVKIETKISDLIPSLSTEKTRGFKADSATLMPPEFDRTEVSGTSATIVWKHIPNRSDIAHFELELEQVSKTTIKSFKTKEGIVNSYTFNDLEDGDKGSVYIVRVRAVLGDGEKSDWMTKTISMKHGITNPVDNIRASQVSESSVTLNWDVPYTNNLKMYEIDVVNSKGDQHLNILTEKLTSQFRIQDLHDGTTYKYRVRAVGTDENKKGPWSEYNTFVTEKSALKAAFSPGVIAGAVVGVVVVLILLVVMIVMCRRRRKHPKAFNVHFTRNDDAIQQIS